MASNKPQLEASVQKRPDFIVIKLELEIETNNSFPEFAANLQFTMSEDSLSLTASAQELAQPKSELTGAHIIAIISFLVAVHSIFIVGTSMCTHVCVCVSARYLAVS